MTEVAVYEGDTDVEPLLLTKAKAKALDSKIRKASDKLIADHEKLGVSADALMGMLQEAADGKIHVALGLPSWTAWFKDAVQIDPVDRSDRKSLVAIMSGKGLSQRAIAGVLGISQKTVDRDLEGESTDSTKTEGLDGKTYNRSVAEDDVIDVEYEEEEPVEEDEAEDEPMKAVDIVGEFDDETSNLVNAVAAMNELTSEPNWSKATKRIAKADLNHLQESITELQKLVDQLMEA